MRENPEKSEMDVFRDVSDRLTKIQHQLHSEYQRDRFLRYQLLAAADVEHVKERLKDRVPTTAQEAMQRIARLLSSDKGSSGAHVTEEAHNQVNYGLGKKFGGQVRKTLRASHRKDPSNRQRLASIKGCWVCPQDHKARDHHSPQEVFNALNRIKKEQPNILFTVDVMQETCYVLATSSMQESSGDALDSEFGEDDIINFAIPEANEAGTNAEMYLANASFKHGRTFSFDLRASIKAMNAALSIGEDERFNGIIIDTGANRRSAMSLEQYRAYWKTFKMPMNINRNDKRGLIGIGGKSTAVGSASIPIPFNDLVIDVEFRILNTRCPSLLSLRDLKKNGLDISVQKDTVSFKRKKQQLVFENDFLKHKLQASDMIFALYTEPELRRLHRVFGHPSVTALQNVLRRANPGKFRPEVRKALEDISKTCDTCERYASKPRRFKLSVGTEDLRFNHTLAVDIMYLFGKPVLHVVDEATHYAAATFMRSVSAEETWEVLLRCWIRTYLGPPDHLHIDQGPNFVAKQFCDSAEAEGIAILEAPTESPSTMTHVKRYHAPLGAAFKRIRDTLPRATETDADCLQLAVKSVNDTIGPEGLCPTLLVYGSIPRPPRRTPADTQLNRAQAMDAAMREVQKEQAKRKIAFVLRHPGGPKQKEQKVDLEKLSSGAPVMVFREKSKEWEGPFPFVYLEGSTVVVQMPTGRKNFRSSVVKKAPHDLTKENWRVVHDDRTKDASYCASDDMQTRGAMPSNELLAAMFGAGEQRHMTPNSKHTFPESRMATART